MLLFLGMEAAIINNDDIVELVINNEKRKVQYRTSSRLQPASLDTQRLRYSQSVRMLAATVAVDRQTGACLSNLGFKTTMGYFTTCALYSIRILSIQRYIKGLANMEDDLGKNPEVSGLV